MELLEKARGRRGLLLDIKGYYSAADQQAFAHTLSRLLARYDMVEATRVCSQNWSLLQALRQVAPAPSLSLHYTIERPAQWRAFLHLLEKGQPLTAVCLHRALLDTEKARLLEEKSIEIFTWTVDDRKEALRLLALGVDGIISNRLSLLAELTTAADRAEM
jgi:glycerophosphoryl diester phosphodiesterase